MIYSGAQEAERERDTEVSSLLDEFIRVLLEASRNKLH
jgi:hypothetical protein